MNLKHLSGSLFHLGLAIIATVFVVPSCQQRSGQNGMDESAFVFETTNIKGNEADYYSRLIQSLLLYKADYGEDVSDYFQVKDAEPLFSEDCMSSNLFALSSDIATWVFSSLDRKEPLRPADVYAARIDLSR